MKDAKQLKIIKNQPKTKDNKQPASRQVVYLVFQKISSLRLFCSSWNYFFLLPILKRAAK